MKKVTKSLFSWLLALCMILTAMPMTAYAAEDTSVSTETELISALANGATDITVTGDIIIKKQLDMGKYAAGSTITFRGTGESSLDFTFSKEGSSFTNNNNGYNFVFEDLKIKVNDLNYKGFQHCISETYTNCTIEGCYWLYGQNAEFTGCTFNQTENYYNVWTYGAKEATFKDCTFNCVGKSALVYKEDGEETYKANFEGCKFNTTKAGINSSKQHVAAIEIDASLNPYEVTVVDCEANVGENGFSGLARIKKGENNCTLNVRTTPRVQLGEDTYPTLKAALEAAENVGGEVTLSLLEDVEWETGANHGSTPLLAANSKVTKLTINGNNKTLTATGDGVGAIGAANDALVVFNEVNVVDKSESYVENSWEHGYLEFRGKLEINNCKFNNAIMLEGESDNLSNEIDAIFNGCSFDSGKENEYALWVSGGRATVKDSTFTGTRGLKMHEAYKTDVESVTVDNCKFGPLSEKPGIAIGTVNESTEVTIKNSKFVDCQAGDQSLYIYETDTPVDTFKFTNQDNYVCNADTDGTHGTTKTINTKPATCKDEGYTGDEVCVACGDVVKAGKVIGKTTHKFVDDKCTVCGVSAVKPDEVQVGTDEAANAVLTETTDKIIDAISKGDEVLDIPEEVAEAICEATQNKQDVKLDTVVVAKPVEESDVDEEAAQLIADKVKEESTDTTTTKVAQYLDLSVVMNVVVNDEVVESGEIAQLSAPITITIAIPESLKTTPNNVKREFFVVRVHGDQTEILPVTENANGTLTFTTDRFSNYALAYKDTTKEMTSAQLVEMLDANGGKLTGNVTITDKLAIPDDREIDLDGHTLFITQSDSYVVGTNTVKFKNGTIDISQASTAGNGIICAGVYGKETGNGKLIFDGVTIAGEGFSPGAGTIFLYQDATLEINNSTINFKNAKTVLGAAYMIYCNDPEGVVNINNSHILFDDVYSGFYNGIVTIKDSEVTMTGVRNNAINSEKNNMDLTVDHSTVTATSASSATEGRGLTVYGNSNVKVINNSTLNMNDFPEGCLKYKEENTEGKLSFDKTSKVTLEGKKKFLVGSEEVAVEKYADYITAPADHKFVENEDGTISTACTHAKTVTKNAKAATCKATGYTGDTVCASCGIVLKKGAVIAKKAHSYKNDKCTVCGATDPAAILAKDVAAGTLALNKKIKTTWKGSKLVVTWGKVSKANGYDIYAAKCGKKYVCVRTITKNSTTSYKFSKIGRTKLSTKNEYRVLVKAYRMVNGKKQYIGTSVETHAVGKNNKKYTNAKSVKVSGGKNVTLKVGKTKKIKATINKESGKKSILKSSHIAKFRYFSSNTNIATVSKKGTIKAKAKGKCNVYVMTANGVKATIKVTVK